MTEGVKRCSGIRNSQAPPGPPTLSLVSRRTKISFRTGYGTTSLTIDLVGKQGSIGLGKSSLRVATNRNRRIVGFLDQERIDKEEIDDGIASCCVVFLVPTGNARGGNCQRCDAGGHVEFSLAIQIQPSFILNIKSLESTSERVGDIEGDSRLILLHNCDWTWDEDRQLSQGGDLAGSNVRRASVLSGRRILAFFILGLFFVKGQIQDNFH